MAIYEIASEF